MIARVLGLIVIGAVLALSLSMIRANSDTISSTRLTQELRATSAAVTSELQRAGGVANPFDLAAAATMGDIDDDTAGCIIYTYSFQNGVNVETVEQAISRSGNAIYVGDACGSGGQKLSSDTVSITGLTFNRGGRTITMTLRGELKLSKGETVSREYSQTVFAPGLSTGT
jgi:hypothetical protein